jgi:transmembrane sensor
MGSPSETVQAEAAAWLVRLQSDRRVPADTRAFQAWVAEDESHAAAFEAASMVWDVTGGLSRDLRGGAPVGRTRRSRRAVVAGGGALLAAGVAVALWRAQEPEIYQTEIGEQKHVALKDGSQVFLDTASRLTVNFTSMGRAATLGYGQAGFHITADPVRPFILEAAQGKIVASASDFNVRHDGERVSVLVMQGSADVLWPDATPARLAPGDRLRLAPGIAAQRDRPQLAPLLAWQTGQAVFENGRLSDAVAEMNRYSTVKLAILDSNAGELRMSGVYAVGDNLAFANSISRLLPIRVVQRENRIDIVTDRRRWGRG